MNDLKFTSDFPTNEIMIDILKKTFVKSWMVDLDNDDINNWLDNFTGKAFDKEAEKRIALWLLCNFTYFNINEVNHLCCILFHNFIHALIEDINLKNNSELDRRIQKCLFTYIGNAGESGAFMLYHFRQEAKLGMNSFCSPDVLITTSSNDLIACIDDVIISGCTAKKFYKKYKEEFERNNTYYLTLITTQEAIDKLNLLGIKVIYCIKFDDRNKLFSKNSLCFYKFKDIKIPAKTLAETYGRIIVPKNPLGFNGGQYCFGLYYNIPNNSLPIFWSSNNWFPILRRKEKSKNGGKLDREYGFFI